MGNSVHMPGWYAPQTHEGKTVAESIADLIGPAAVFDRYRAHPEAMFVFGRGLIIQVAMKGGGTLFNEYDGEWLAALLQGKRVIHETSELYTHNPLNHLGAARLYAGILCNGETSTVPRKHHNDLSEFWGHSRDFEVIIPS